MDRHRCRSRRQARHAGRHPLGCRSRETLRCLTPLLGVAGGRLPSRLYRYSYNGSTDTYTRDSGFPVTINNFRTETLVIDKDSSGQLWATWVQGGKVWVNASVCNPGLQRRELGHGVLDQPRQRQQRRHLVADRLRRQQDRCPMEQSGHVYRLLRGPLRQRRRQRLDGRDRPPRARPRGRPHQREDGCERARLRGREDVEDRLGRPAQHATRPLDRGQLVQPRLWAQAGSPYSPHRPPRRGERPRPHVRHRARIGRDDLPEDLAHRARSRSPAGSGRRSSRTRTTRSTT